MTGIFWNKHKKCQKLKWNHTWYDNGKSKYCSICAVWYEATKYLYCPCCGRKLRAKGNWWTMPTKKRY